MYFGKTQDVFKGLIVNIRGVDTLGKQGQNCWLVLFELLGSYLSVVMMFGLVMFYTHLQF